MRHPCLVDMVEDVIGSDILCWIAILWTKEPGAESFVGWHQDFTYWGLDNRELVTVWVALFEASEQAGCISVLPASHHQTFNNDGTYDINNLLTRGQHIHDIDPTPTSWRIMPDRPTLCAASSTTGPTLPAPACNPAASE